MKIEKQNGKLRRLERRQERRGLDLGKKVKRIGALGKNETRKQRSVKQENRTASLIKGQRQPASGALLGFKGDVKKADILDKVKLLGECKTTKNETYRVDRKELSKIARECDGQPDVYPFFQVTFEGIRRGVDEDWFMIPKDLFELLLENFEERINVL